MNGANNFFIFLCVLWAVIIVIKITVAIKAPQALKSLDGWDDRRRERARKLGAAKAGFSLFRLLMKKRSAPRAGSEPALPSAGGRYLYLSGCDDDSLGHEGFW